jgi:hypothetical protein
MLESKKRDITASLNYFSIFILGVLIHLSFAQDNGSYQTECVTTNIDGYVTINIWDKKEGPKYKFEQASKDAVEAILFSGISGSNDCQTQAPLLLTTKDKANFKTIEKSFFSKKGPWKLFTRTATSSTTLPANLRPNNSKVYQICISKTELRKYLEQQKIIQTLNNGF